MTGDLNQPFRENINPKNTIKNIKIQEKTKNHLNLFALLEPYWSPIGTYTKSKTILENPPKPRSSFQDVDLKNRIPQTNILDKGYRRPTYWIIDTVVPGKGIPQTMLERVSRKGIPWTNILEWVPGKGIPQTNMLKRGNSEI